MAKTPSLNVSSREADIAGVTRAPSAARPPGACVTIRPRTVATGPAGP